MIAVAAVAADDDNDIEDKLILSNHGDILLNKSNSSMFLYVQIYWNWKFFDLIRASGISMKSETPHH